MGATPEGESKETAAMADARPFWNTQPMQQQKTGPGAPPAGSEGVVPPVTNSQDTPDPDGDDEKLSAGGLKALKAERAKAAAAEKRATAAEQKLADEAKAKLGEKERAEVERDEARRERDEARAESARLRVGAKYGLSPEDVGDLSTSGTPEDFDARAKRLAERLGAKPGSKSGLPESPNAGRETPKLSGAEAGKAEALRRFPQLAK